MSFFAVVVQSRHCLQKHAWNAEKTCTHLEIFKIFKIQNVPRVFVRFVSNLFPSVKHKISIN